MPQRSFFKTVNRTFLTIIMAFTAVICILLTYGAYRDYSAKTELLRERTLNTSRERLRNHIQNIRSLAEAKLRNVESLVKEDVFYRVQEAIDIAYEIYGSENLGKNRESVRELIIETLRSIRYNRGDGYFFIGALDDNVMVVNPQFPEMEGRSVKDDPNLWQSIGKPFSEIVETYGDGFHTYSWPRTNESDKRYEKVSFVKFFAPFNWYIGSGLFLDDYRTVIENDIIKDAQIYFQNNRQIVLYDGQGNLLVGDERKGTASVGLFQDGEFRQVGDILYYSEVIEQLGWRIGDSIDLGYVRDEISSELSQARTNYLWQFALIILVGVLMSLLFLRLFQKIHQQVQQNFDLFSQTFQDAAQTNQTLVVDQISYKELADLCGPANAMIEENRMIKDDLEAQVELRTAELKGAQDQLIIKERLAVLGQLTATVSHELRNPLGVISNALHNIQKTLESGNEELVKKSVDVSMKNISRCDQIIDELLEYGRKGQPVFTSVDLDGLLRELIDEFQWSDDIQVIHGLESQAVVAGDSERLRRVVINLLSNSQQALKDSEGSEKKITITSCISGRHAEVIIEDNGPGVPDELREKIFEPLFSTRNFGVGLGMTIVKDILVMHSGEIRHEVPEQGGCRFVVKIPVSKTSAT